MQIPAADDVRFGRYAKLDCCWWFGSWQWCDGDGEGNFQPRGVVSKDAVSRPIEARIGSERELGENIAGTRWFLDEFRCEVGRIANARTDEPLRILCFRTPGPAIWVLSD